MSKIPQKLIPFKNLDKLWHEKWTDKDKKHRPLNYIHPFRLLAHGSPNSGKTTLFKNIILHQVPPFEEVIVCHEDPMTQEYSDIKADIITELPTVNDFQECDKKRLLIIDDIDIKALNKKDRSLLDRIFGYISTHKNLSVCLGIQDPFQVPMNIRRCTNIYYIWKYTDDDTNRILARRMGTSFPKFMKYISKLKSRYDNICFDFTDGSPYPIRLNGFEVLKDE